MTCEPSDLVQEPFRVAVFRIFPDQLQGQLVRFIIPIEQECGVYQKILPFEVMRIQLQAVGKALVGSGLVACSCRIRPR